MRIIRVYSTTSPSFRYWSIPVSEIHKFNRKKKKNEKKKMMNNSKNDYFQFNTLPMVELPNLVFDGIVTMMSIEIQITAS